MDFPPLEREGRWVVASFIIREKGEANVKYSGTAAYIFTPCATLSVVALSAVPPFFLRDLALPKRQTRWWGWGGVEGKKVNALWRCTPSSSA